MAGGWGEKGKECRERGGRLLVLVSRVQSSFRYWWCTWTTRHRWVSRSGRRLACWPESTEDYEAKGAVHWPKAKGGAEPPEKESAACHK